MSYDVMKIRKEFPMLQETMSGKPLIYLDSAATTHKPQVVIDEISHFYAKEYATVHRSIYEHAALASERYANVRSQVKEFIHAASEEEIIFTRGATEAINVVALCYASEYIKSGDEILISEMEHHANIVPWQMVRDKTNAKLVIAPMNDKGEIILEEFHRLLTRRTKLVALSHVSNAFGTINPIKELVRISHEVGAVVVIDGAQAAGHIPIDVQEMDADFYAFSAHKMYGPTGVGVLYGKKELLTKMKPYHGGGDMIQEVTFAKTTFLPPPLKFEAGTPMIAEVIGLGAAINYLESLDRIALDLHEKELLLFATEEMKKIPGVRIYGEAKEKGPIISFTIEGIHPLDFGTLISLKGVALRTGYLCAQPAIQHFGLNSIIRISFGLYTTKSDINSFLMALEETIALLTGSFSY